MVHRCHHVSKRIVIVTTKPLSRFATSLFWTDFLQTRFVTETVMFTLKIEFLTELIIDYLKLEHQLMDFHCLSTLHREPNHGGLVDDTSCGRG